MHHRSPRLLTAVPAVLGLAVLGLAQAGCTRNAAATPAAEAPLAVEAVPVEFTSEPVPIEVAGVLSRQSEADLSFKTGGIIATVAVRAGDRVKAGQVLATLRLDEIDAQVAAARTGVEKARRDAARAEALHADRVATLENAQDARSAVELAEAGLRAAEFNREHSVITAPSDGQILRRLAEPDELAGPGRAILAFASDAGGWLVRVGVPEGQVVRLHPGDRATVALDGGPETPATISQIAEGADAATRTVEVEVRPEGPVVDGQRSGFVVRTRLIPQPVAKRPAVPLAALVEGKDNRGYVFLLSADGRTVRRQNVEIDAIAGPRAYLRTALPAGSRVVTTGAEFLTDGRTVSAGLAPR